MAPVSESGLRRALRGLAPGAAAPRFAAPRRRSPSGQHGWGRLTGSGPCISHRAPLARFRESSLRSNKVVALRRSSARDGDVASVTLRAGNRPITRCSWSGGLGSHLRRQIL